YYTEENGGNVICDLALAPAAGSGRPTTLSTGDLVDEKGIVWSVHGEEVIANLVSCGGVCAIASSGHGRRLGPQVGIFGVSRDGRYGAVWGHLAVVMLESLTGRAPVGVGKPPVAAGFTLTSADLYLH